MNGFVLLVAFVQAFCEVVAQGMAAAPWLWSTFAVFVFALSAAVWGVLEHKGWRAAGWGCIAAGAFAAWLVMA